MSNDHTNNDDDGSEEPRDDQPAETGDLFDRPDPGPFDVDTGGPESASNPADYPDDTDEDGRLDRLESDEALADARAYGASLARLVVVPGRICVAIIASFAMTIAELVTRVFPVSDKFWSRWLKMGYKGYYKTSGADLLSHKMKEGRLIPTPLKYNPDHQRFEEVNGDDWWRGSGDGKHTLLGPGGVPCAFGASQATELGSQVKAEYAEALDLGYGMAVFSDAKVTVETLQLDAGERDRGAAVADGGQNYALQQYVTVDNPGVLSDAVVPLGELYRDDAGTQYDARLLSTNDYYEVNPEVGDSEEFHNQEVRGRLSAMDPSDARSFAIKMMLVAGGIIALVLLGPSIIDALLGSGGGGGGGGGGGLIPITIGVWGWLL